MLTNNLQLNLSLHKLCKNWIMCTKLVHQSQKLPLHPLLVFPHPNKMSVLETIDSNLLANLLTDIETNDTNPNQNVQKENLTLVPVNNDEPNDDELVDFLKKL